MGCNGGLSGEKMAEMTTARSGSLEANLISVKMDIDDDDDDVIIAVVSVVNEAPVPMGGLDVSVITNTGAKHPSKEGVSSLGPGIERNWTFEFPLSMGEWTFSLSGNGNSINMGPYDSAFEFKMDKSRKLSSNIGSSLFAGAFGDNLDSFGKVKEREMIDSAKVEMTSYAAENLSGGKTLIEVNPDLLSSGHTSASGNRAREAPPIVSSKQRETPMASLARTEDPLLAHVAGSESKRESPVGNFNSDKPAAIPIPPKSEFDATDILLAPIVAKTKVKPEAPPHSPPGPPTPPAGSPTPPGPPTPPSEDLTPPAGPPTPRGLSTPPPLPQRPDVVAEEKPGPLTGPPTPPSGPSAPPSGPPPGPSTPPSGPSTSPAGPSSPPTGPPSGPPTAPAGPSAPPTGPPTPPSGPPSGPPTPPAGPPTGPPTPPSGPPSGPPTTPAGPPAGPPKGPPSSGPTASD